MRYFRFLLVLVFFLNGCVQNTPSSENIANSALQSLNAVSASLPPECKNNALESQINAAKTAINATVAACQVEKDAITAEKVKWKFAFFALLLIVLANVARKVLK